MFSCEYADPCCKTGPEGPTGPIGPTGPFLEDLSIEPGVAKSLVACTAQFDTRSFTSTLSTLLPTPRYIIGGGGNTARQAQSVLLGPAGTNNASYNRVGSFNQFVWMKVTNVTSSTPGLPSEVYVPAYWKR